MTRKFKTLGLALAAVFAISALGASAASAAEFHSAVSPQTVSGGQTTSHVFTTTSGTVTCKTATFSGTTSSTTSATQTISPNYDNCTAFGFIGVPVHENGCDYTFNASGTTDLVCPVVNKVQQVIEITVPGCTTTVGTQHIGSGNVFTNEAGGSLVVDTNIKKTETTDGIEYRECGGTLQDDGKYEGTTTVSGEKGSLTVT